MTSVITPAAWPANIVEQIIRYASDSFFPGLDYFEANNVQPFPAVCQNWKRVLHILQSRRIHLELGADGFAANRNHFNQNIQDMSLHRFVRYASVDIMLESITSGALLKHLKTQTPYTNARYLAICIDKNNTANNVIPYNLPTSEFADLMLRVFPNIQTVTVNEEPRTFNSVRHIIGNIYNTLVQRYQLKKLANSTTLANISINIYNNSICMNLLCVFEGITSITLNALLLNERGVTSLLHRNRATLRKVDLTVLLSTQCSGVLIDDEGRPVIYPCVEWLRIAVYSAVAFGSREYIPEADLFPRLRHLLIPGMYPFSSNVLPQDANSTLETLTLGINEMEVESFVSLGLFTQKYSNLTSVTLMTTPTSDSHLLPAVIPSIAISDRYACLYVNMALKFSAKLEKLSVDEVNAEPLLEALAKSPRQLHCLHTLVVANTELEICNVAHIGAMLPALVDLEYSASSFATTIGSSKSVCSKIDNVTVNWRPSANENNVLGADTLEQMTAYAASLSFQVPSTRRIQFASNEQTAITECNTQLQEMCTQPCIVKLVKQTTLQNVFSLCQST